MSKLFKIIYFVAFIFAVLFFLYGLFEHSKKDIKPKLKPKQVTFLDNEKSTSDNIQTASSINLCKSHRWKKLELINSSKREMLVNKELFNIYPTTIEKNGRHKGELSISLIHFFDSQLNIEIKLCDAQIFTHSVKEVKDSNIRLVMNSKGALKLIKDESNKIKVLAKYLYSVTN